MEAIENNPVMYELLFELPWRTERFTAEEWLTGYVKARYGKTDEQLLQAWDFLAHTVYNCPPHSTQDGTVESVFAANPKLDIRRVSCCSTVRPFYNTDSVRLAAESLLAVADAFKGNNNFEYDLVDVVRQTVANRAYYLQQSVTEAYKAKDRTVFKALSREFLELLLAQDMLLQTRREFMLGTWTNQARKIGQTDAAKDLYDWNARTQITVWGNHNARYLHNYAYKEWSGVLKDVYYPRWEAFFTDLDATFDGKEAQTIDYAAMDEAWVKKNNIYPSEPTGDAVETAKEIYNRYVRNH